MVNTEDLVYELKPLEKLTIYQGIDVIEPTLEQPIRSYVPRIKESFIESAKVKPGFDRMYKCFLNLYKIKKLIYVILMMQQRLLICVGI